jgi:splicing factor 3B subunit 1
MILMILMIYTTVMAPKHLLNEFADEDAEDPFEATAKSRQISARQGDYHARRFDRESAVRVDAFAASSTTETVAGEGEASSYGDVMKLAELEREELRVKRAIEKQREDGLDEQGEPIKMLEAGDATPKRDRWDEEEENGGAQQKRIAEVEMRDGTGSAVVSKRGEWDDSNTGSIVDVVVKKKRSRWDDETPAGANNGGAAPGETPKRSRWDQTPVASGIMATPMAGGFSQFGMTPGGEGMVMPELDKRNRYLSDDELNTMLPIEGYEIVDPPPGYAPVRTAAQKLQSTPMSGNGGFIMQDEAASAGLASMVAELPTEIEGVGELAFFKQEDAQYFAKILGSQDESGLTVEELKERKIMRLLLKVKNGTPPMRKTALRQITDKAREFGAAPLFDKILPLLMERTLEDQERHLLVKVIDRVLYKLDDLVRPYVHKILVVIEPLLIDEDYYARVEGREIISNLSKAAGLAHMISTMRPDIDHADEYVRNTTARAFSVVASALGIPSLLPFLKAVCRSKKSWQARHTGIKIIQQIAIMMGCAVLPHLKNLVEAVAHGLEDEQQKVRTMTALCIAALAEAAAPYGIESFDSVLKPLWTGIRKHRGKGLAAFLKAIGFIIPLMDPEYANYYTKEVMVILIREFQSPDEEMKKIVLKVVKQCAGTEGVQPAYVKTEILPEFFKNFLVRRMALDRRNYRQVVETTVELAQKAGVSEIVGRLVNDLKDESEPYRKMVMEIITKVVAGLGAADIDERLEVQLIDGIIYAFQEQSVEDNVMLDGFGTVVNSLGRFLWFSLGLYTTDDDVRQKVFELNLISPKLFRPFCGDSITKVPRSVNRQLILLVNLLWSSSNVRRIVCCRN